MLNRPENTHAYHFAGLLLMGGLVLLFWALAMPVFSVYEKDIFEGAINMLQTGNWWVPHNLAGEAILHTPFLPYWLASAGPFLLPESLLGFRLLNLLLTLGGFWGFYQVLRRYLDARAAFYSCGVLFSSLLFSWRLVLATPDSLATLSICASLFGFYLSLKTRKRVYTWLLYCGLSLCLLVNGLVPFLLTLLIVVLYLMFRIKMNSETLNRIKAGPGILLSLAVGLPWFVDMAWKNSFDDVFAFFFGSYYSGGEAAMEGSFYLPFVFVLLGLLPFGIFLPKAFMNSWKLRHKKDLLLLSLLALLLMLVFFAFADHFYPHYLLPAFPFASILIGFKFSQLAGRTARNMKMPLEMALLLLLAFLLPGGILFLSQWGFGLGGYESLLFWIMLALLPAGTLTSLLLWRAKRSDAGFITLVVTYLIFNVLLLQLADKIGGLADLLKVFLA